MSRKKKDAGFPPAPPRPGIHAQPPAKAADIKAIPKDWEPIWDDEFREAFESLVPKQRLFVVELVRTGFKKSEAFARAYPGAAYSSGIISAIFAKPEVKLIMSRFTDWAYEDLFEAREVIKDAFKAERKIYVEGVEIAKEPDHAIRLKAVEVLNKMNGANKEADAAPPPKPAGAISGDFAVNFNFFLEQQGLPAIKLGSLKAIDAPKKA
jgi:hypothetical protein